MSIRQRLLAKMRATRSQGKAAAGSSAATHDPSAVFPLVPQLSLPNGVSERQLFAFLESVLVGGAPPEEMKNYCRSDFRRFVYTYGLVRDVSGSCLELGANPYFTTLLLRQFTKLDLTLANYFVEGGPEKTEQEVSYREFSSGEIRILKLQSHHFNIEKDHFPFENGRFDAVLFCEIIEHLLMDPTAALREIKRVLKPGGALILTTPNVSRLENVARMISGANIYDPYSGYGPSDVTTANTTNMGLRSCSGTWASTW